MISQQIFDFEPRISEPRIAFIAEFIVKIIQKSFGNLKDDIVGIGAGIILLEQNSVHQANHDIFEFTVLRANFKNTGEQAETPGGAAKNVINFAEFKSVFLLF